MDLTDQEKIAIAVANRSEIQNKLSEYISTPSDINEHLSALRDLAKEVNHITEFGFRNGMSFTALLCGNPLVAKTYDILISKHDVERIIQIAPKNIKISFHELSTLEADIEETDLLFIDTLHTYTQLKEELALHGNKARKYLVFHDTETFGNKGEDGKEPGLLAAIQEFRDQNPHWQWHKHYANNNGLTVLRRHEKLAA